MTRLLIIIFLIPGIITSCVLNTDNNSGNPNKINSELLGEWVKVGHNGPVSLNLKKDGMATGTFLNNPSNQPVVKYIVKNDSISFLDKKGYSCKGFGHYKLYQTEYYIAFDVIDDKCGGRIKTMSGYWTRPYYQEFIDSIDSVVSISPDPQLLLTRARIYMAVGESEKAKSDLDSYLLVDSTDARVFINRAATRFPHGLDSIVYDCNKSIAIDPYNKNAYFLRGLALYDLGEEEKGCEDFKKAIDLGFSVLKVAEQQKCNEYWE